MARGDREVDARVFHHPLRVIGLVHGRCAPEDGRIEADVGLEIVDAPEITLAADDVFELGEFDGTAADVGIAGADRFAHFLHGDAEILGKLRYLGAFIIELEYYC